MKLKLQAGLVKILNVEGLPVMRLWHVVYPSNKRLSPASEALRCYLLEMEKTFLEREFSEIFLNGLTKVTTANQL